MAYRWIALLVCLVAAIAPTQVSACGLVVATPAEHADAAEAIFRGRVLSIDPPGLFWDRYSMTAHIQVITSWKGAVEAQVEVKGDTVCGPGFTVGSEYLVFAKWDSVITFRAITMGGTEPLSPDEDSEALKYVEAHYPSTDLSKEQAASSCSSTPGGDCLAALVLLACWLGVRVNGGSL